MSAKRSAFLVAAFVVLVSSRADAQRTRRRFEPTDLRLTPMGVAEVDLQAGWLHGVENDDVFAPDVEASLGIASHAELEIDTTYGLDGGEPKFLDDTWTSLRIGMLDVREEGAAEASWAAGVQAGPKIPTAPGSRGLGVEALAIVGRNVDRIHLFGQVGVLLDPRDRDVGYQRPYGLEGGLDLDLDLDDVDRWSIKAELGAVRFFSPHADLLHVTAGAACRVMPSLELSAVAVGGLLDNGDRFGVLFGAAYRFRAF